MYSSRNEPTAPTDGAGQVRNCWVVVQSASNDGVLFGGGRFSVGVMDLIYIATAFPAKLSRY